VSEAIAGFIADDHVIPNQQKSAKISKKRSHFMVYSLFCEELDFVARSATKSNSWLARM